MEVSEQEGEIRGLDMGAMDVICKPFDPAVFVSRIQRVLQIDATRKNLEMAARQDVLAGLWNRKYMEEMIERLARSNKGCFFLLDLDNFKWANDHLGHIAGDELLIDFARGIENSVENGIVSRIGGDEFAVLLPDIHEQKEAEQAAELMKRETEKRICNMGKCGEYVSVSIGITALSEEGNTFRKLYNQADKALYYVKQNGKRGYHFYSPVRSTDYMCEEKGVAADLEQIQEMVREKSARRGAYVVEQDGFKSIYQFIARYIERTRQEVQILLLTLYRESRESEDAMCMERAMGMLGKEITQHLRKGDISNRFSSSQYVVIVMDASTKNGKVVAERIIQNYNVKNGPEGIALRYDIRKISTNGEK